MSDASARQRLDEAVLHFERLTALMPAAAVLEISQLDLIRAFDAADVRPSILGHDVAADIVADLLTFSHQLVVRPDESLFRALFPESILVLRLDDARRVMGSLWPPRRHRFATTRADQSRAYLRARRRLGNRADGRTT